jgi:hypothetical protein
MLSLTTAVSKLDSLVEKHTDFDYLNLWIAELCHLKATIAILNCPVLKVRTPVKGTFHKLNCIDLEDLEKKRREMDALDWDSRRYNGEQIDKLGHILKMLCDAAYASYSIDNFSKLQNTLKLLHNLITKHRITPFYHLGAPLWQYFSFLALMGTLSLRKIREGGYDTFQRRYSAKQARTELKLISAQLGQSLETQPMTHIFEPKYFLSQLEPNNTKCYWFEE